MEENNKTEKQITIYLEDSGYAHSFKKNESIHSIVAMDAENFSIFH